MEPTRPKETLEVERQVGSAVRELRRRQRLSQVDLARRAGVSLSALRGLEVGAGSSLATLARVVHALERDEWWTSLVPATPTISPMAMLRERQAAATPRGRRAATTRP
ncbi:MAG: helix-turn-helix transcriptional regulator [Acidobacteriota bacterium]|nr:helix-turn-helix transcriptional regulator [Acidobacteriota bacterium]